MNLQVVQPITDDSFDSVVFGSELPVLVDFWATWCPPCRALAPIIEELASQYRGKLTVLKLDVDENAATAARFGVQGIPTLILFKDGDAVERIVGFLPKEELVARFKNHLTEIVSNEPDRSEPSAADRVSGCSS